MKARCSKKEAEEAEVAEEVVAVAAAVEAVVMVEVAEPVVVTEVTASHVHNLTDPDKVVVERAAVARLCQTRTISHACERSLRL